jgi:hypothetical protein
VETPGKKWCQLKGPAVGSMDFFFFLWEWGLNLGLCAYKAGSLLLEPHLQPIFALVI